MRQFVSEKSIIDPFNANSAEHDVGKKLSVNIYLPFIRVLPASYVINSVIIIFSKVNHTKYLKCKDKTICENFDSSFC